MSAYLMRLICAAIICALVRAIAGERAGLLRLICGIFLALTALSVPVELELPEWDPDQIARQARAAASEGAESAQREREAIITEALQAYIEREAAGLDLSLTARVELDEAQMPTRIWLTGTAAPEAQRKLTDVLLRELGLEEGDVKWIEPHQSSE